MLFRTSTKALSPTTLLDGKFSGAVEIKKDLTVEGVVKDANTITKEEYKAMKREILKNA